MMHDDAYRATTGSPDAVTRREALRTLGRMASGILGPVCITPMAGSPPREPRLRARARTPNDDVLPAGTREFTIPLSRAVVHVPSFVKRDTPAGLVVFLHGARRTVDVFVERHRTGADAAG
jgi:hypothetical protein